jgi:hypothetical protein
MRQRGMFGRNAPTGWDGYDSTFVHARTASIGSSRLHHRRAVPRATRPDLATNGTCRTELRASRAVVTTQGVRVASVARSTHDYSLSAASFVDSLVTKL